MDDERIGSSDFRILVVDDEKSVLDLMTDILRECGWTPEGFTSPLGALDSVGKCLFDALVLDLYMPELPGLLFHAKLKVIDPELARRTIFVTGHFSRKELESELEALSSLVMKPFNPARFVGAVTRVLPAVPRHVVAMASPALLAEPGAFRK